MLNTLFVSTALVGESFQTYLPWQSIIPKGTIQGSTVIGLLVFFSYAIVLNTVVPISLYVSVEVSAIKDTNENIVTKAHTHSSPRSFDLSSRS